jgi:hypothetical protein
MSRLTNFGEQFASKVLEKTYQNSIIDSVANRNYEGEIKKPGDRVNILSFLNSGTLSDYVVGTDMSSEALVDSEDQLVVEKRRYWNFSLDRLEDQFTFADDIVDYISNDYAKQLEKEVDTYALDRMAAGVRAGNWIGTNLTVVGGGSGTMASITTTATGGTVTLSTYDGTYETSNIGSVENPVDGVIYFAGFDQADVGKGFRLRSTAAFVTPWYRISSVTSSTVATLTEWDEAVSGSDFEEGYTLRGLFGGDGVNFTKNGTGEASFLTYQGNGWEFQAAAATAITSAVIYNQVTLLAEALDQGEVENMDRHLTVPAQLVTQLKQASQLQPTGIAEIFTGTVINGRVMRVGAFDVHMAAGSRVSTRAGHSTASAATRIGAEVVASAGAVGNQIVANHTGMFTFAEKWSESRVVDAENQFAKKYQGLFLYGGKVPAYRRKYGAMLFGSF